jgi:hypothetical protein
MERRLPFPGKIWLLGLSLFATLSAAVFLERQALLRWYTIRGLAKASERDRPVWVERVAGLGKAGIPSLMGCLADREKAVCANAHAALSHMIAHWDTNDPGRSELAERLAEAFPLLSSPGQRVSLEIDEILLQDARSGPLNDTILASAAKLLIGAGLVSDENVHREALKLAGIVADLAATPEGLAACRELTCACLRDEAGENRIEALRLVLQPGLNSPEAVVPLLHDPEPEIRRLAMLGIGSSPTAISTDDLLVWLHDPDEDVRHLCEEALRSRGLQERHLQLGRLMTDSRPGTRLQVLDILRRANDLEPGIWLRRLSHDAAPAVRAAAARAAGEASADLSDRLEQMAQDDPCPTVRQLARYYLKSPASGAEPRR